MSSATHPTIHHFSKEDFLPEFLQFIPNMGREFILPPKLHSLCNIVSSGDALSVLFHGPSGTGKTINCKLTCQNICLPIMETINCTENLDEFVLGKYLPDNGKIVFKESYVTKAIRYGGAVVFEEINFSKPQYLAFLNSLLDDNGFVRLDNGDTVRRHKNFRFFATMNVGYFGTKQLNQALYNRFNSIIYVPNLDDGAIKKMLTERVGATNTAIDSLLAVYTQIKKKIDAEELDIVLSPRNLENWARLAKYEGYIKAAEKTLIPIAKNDTTLEKEFRNLILSYRWE